MGHLLGDVPALLLVGVALAVLVVASGLKQPSTDVARLLTRRMSLVRPENVPGRRLAVALPECGPGVP
jgi:hypothetical protein